MTMHTTGREDPLPYGREDAVYEKGCELLKSAQTYGRDRQAVLDEMMEREGWFDQMANILGRVMQPQFYNAGYIYTELCDMIESAAMRVAEGRVPQGDDE